MSNFCNKCWDFHGPHSKCIKFAVCFPESDPDGWRTIWALDEEEAVEKISKRTDSDSAEYAIAENGGCDRVMVRKADTENAEIREYSVTAETQVVYTAYQITPHANDKKTP